MPVMVSVLVVEANESAIVTWIKLMVEQMPLCRQSKGASSLVPVCEIFCVQKLDIWYLFVIIIFFETCPKCEHLAKCL